MAQSSTFRLATWAAIAAAIAACQPQTARTEAPVPTPTPAEPASSSAPLAAIPSEPVASPLPAESVDSDLEAPDQAAIENLLESDQLQAYLPADLINDGGVILYQTLQVRDRDAEDRERVRTAETRPEVPTAPPEMWKRLQAERGGRQLKVRRQEGMSQNKQRAHVVVRLPRHGTLAYRDARSGKAVQKRYTEVFERAFFFQRADNRWQLAGLTPIHVESQGGRSGLEIASVKIFAEGASEPALALTDRDRVIAPEAVPLFKAGQRIRVEVASENAKGQAVFVFAHMAGQSDRARRVLLDDGTGGDATAQDGVYTGTFVVPATAGLRHVAIDVLDPSTFMPGGLYRSNALGVSFRVEE